MKLGVEIFFEQRLDLVRGKRVGLITNPTGVDARLVSIVERFRSHPDINLVALYGPEHGVRGNAQAGEYVAFQQDEHFKLPVFSLYGQSQHAPANALAGIDEQMRSYDTQHTGKTVERGMLADVDVLVFDLQDIGTRVYTYIATMAYAMQAAAAAGIPFVVLDRPNPIAGVTMEGPILEYPAYSSFIGLYPIPLRHGMTAGELARLFNAKFFAGASLDDAPVAAASSRSSSAGSRCHSERASSGDVPAKSPRKTDLTVVPMAGWRRCDWFDATSLPWVLPSPNMPTLDTATVYPGQVILEGTNLSEGRGTTKPFEVFGAPWIDGYVLARELNALGLPGVTFREAWFTPTFSKFAGERCGGCQLHVIDREAYRPIAATLAVLQVVKKIHGAKLELHADYFDKVMGTSTVRAALARGEPWTKIVACFEPGLADFAKFREPFLLYS